MKKIGEAYDRAAAEKRHRQYTWSRRTNGFSDMPLWRLVAQRSNLPIYQVLAFVNRLEELANNAANHGLQRGSVEQFDPDEFGLALGMSTDDAARIFVTLEDSKIGWIADGHVSSFWDRNPDREEDAEDVRNRKRRSRSRAKIREQLAALARQGRLAAEDRIAIEVTLNGISDAELAELQNRLARAELSTEPLTSRRSQSDRSDIVTVTPEKRTLLEQTKASAVDNTGAGVRGETGSSPGGNAGESGGQGIDATRWIETEGIQLVEDRLQVKRQLVELYIERWRRDIQDDAVLKQIILGADKSGYIGGRFHTIITDQLRRNLIAIKGQAPLPLPPTVISGPRKESA